MGNNYTPYNDIYNIWSAKKSWDTGDENQRKKAQEDAAKYYNNLKAYGYDSYAETLKNSNSEQAGDFYRKVAKTGKTQFRPYVYNKLKQYGMTESDVDRIIKWDNDTGEILLGGKNIGKPSVVVDGTSYYEDTSVIDNAVDDFIKTSGKSKSYDVLHNKGYEELMDAQFEDRKTANAKDERIENKIYENPFEGEVADSIRASYGFKGTDAYNNALAESAGANGGNVDSFGQAQANRWAAYYNSLANDAILQYQDNTVNAAQNNYNSFIEGNSIQNADTMATLSQMYAESEGMKDNELSRKMQLADLYGYDPETMNGNYGDTTSYNPDIDYQKKLDSIKEKLEVPGLSDQERMALVLQYNSYATQRNNKINSNPDLYGDLEHTALIPVTTSNERISEFEMDETKKANVVANADIKAGITGYAPVEIDGRYYDVYGNPLSDEEVEKIKERNEKYEINYNAPTMERHSVDTGADLTKFEISTNAAVANHASDNELAASNYASDIGYAADVEVARIKGEYDYLTGSNTAAIKANADMYGADRNLEGKIYTADKNLEGEKYAVDKNAETKDGKENTGKTGSVDLLNPGSNEYKPLSDVEVGSYVKGLNQYLINSGKATAMAGTITGNLNYYNFNGDRGAIINKVFADSSLSDEQAYYLLNKIGIPDDAINAFVKDNRFA